MCVFHETGFDFIQLFFFLLFYFLTLQYCIGFAIYQIESPTGIHVFPILNPPPSSRLPPQTFPLGRPSAPAPSIQYRASNLDWQLFSYMIFYMFQCHSPKYAFLEFSKDTHKKAGASKLDFIFKLYNIVLVLPYIKMNLPQAYTCSPS